MLAARLLTLLSLICGLLCVTRGIPVLVTESGARISTEPAPQAPLATLDAQDDLKSGFSDNHRRATPPGRWATTTPRFFELPGVARPQTTPPLRWALADGPKTERGPPRSSRGA